MGQILVEMHLAGWNIHQSRTLTRYGKTQRSDWIEAEQRAFIHHLRAGEAELHRWID